MLCSNCKTESKLTWAALTTTPEVKPQQPRIQTPPPFTRKFPAPMQEVPQTSFKRRSSGWAQGGWLLLSAAAVTVGLVELRQAPLPRVAASVQPPRAGPPAVVVDSIATKSMAPARTLPLEKLAKSPIFLQARDGLEEIAFRRGPGTDFAQVGQADPYLQYKVKEWRGRWFEIETDGPGKKTAWVHLDQVEIISEDNHESN